MLDFSIIADTHGDPPPPTAKSGMIYGGPSQIPPEFTDDVFFSREPKLLP